MGKIHRYKDPGYFLFPGESFPGTSDGTIGLHTYDRVNVVSEGVGGSGSAMADSKKSSGPTVGTYFVAFGEEGRSTNANRGFRAVFESLDVVDDLFRTSIPRLTTQASSNPAASSIVITGSVFVGDNASTPAGDLVYITDSAGRRIYNGLTKIDVTAIDDGTPGNSVIGQGWYTNPTVRFNAVVNTSYILNWGTRTSTARVIEQEREVLWTSVVRASRSGSRGESVAVHGLDEAYRRATGLTSPTASPDTAGSGASIFRDGKALSLSFPVLANYTTTRPPDPFQAGFSVGFNDYTATAPVTGSGGDMGYVGFTARVEVGGSGELSAGASLSSLLAQYIPRDIRATSLGGGTPATYIAKGAAATLNPGAVEGNRVQLASPYWFDNSDRTAIRSGIDLLLVTFPGGAQQAYRIVLDLANLGSDSARLLTLAGGTPSFSSGTAVTVQWFSAHVSVGGGVYTGASGVGHSLEHFQPNRLRIGGSGTYNDELSRFIGHAWGVGTGVAPSSLMAWGATDSSTGSVYNTLVAYSDGSLVADRGPYDTYRTLSAGRIKHSFTHRSLVVSADSSNRSFVIDPSNRAADNGVGATGSGYQHITFRPTGTLGAAITVNINGVADNLSEDGVVFEFIFENHNGLDVTMSWDSVFVFQNPTDAQFGTANTTPGKTVRWRGYSTLITGLSGDVRVFLMERLEYSNPF